MVYDRIDSAANVGCHRRRKVHSPSHPNDIEEREENRLIIAFESFHMERGRCPTIESSSCDSMFVSRNSRAHLLVCWCHFGLQPNQIHKLQNYCYRCGRRLNRRLSTVNVRFDARAPIKLSDALFHRNLDRFRKK